MKKQKTTKQKRAKQEKTASGAWVKLEKVGKDSFRLCL